MLFSRFACARRSVPRADFTLASTLAVDVVLFARYASRAPEMAASCPSIAVRAAISAAVCAVVTFDPRWFAASAIWH
jgi:hypothetical protein